LTLGNIQHYFLFTTTTSSNINTNNSRLGNANIRVTDLVGTHLLDLTTNDNGTIQYPENILSIIPSIFRNNSYYIRM